MPDDSIASARREEAIERAECAADSALKRPSEIVKAILSHRDEMAALCEKHGTDPLDIECMLENLAEWHSAIQRDVRKDAFTGDLEWHA